MDFEEEHRVETLEQTVYELRREMKSLLEVFQNLLNQERGGIKANPTYAQPEKIIEGIPERTLKMIARCENPDVMFERQIGKLMCYPRAYGFMREHWRATR